MRLADRIARAAVVAFSIASAVRAQTARESVDANGSQAAGTSQLPAAAGDGTFVAFVSDAANLVPQDDNRSRDVFLRNRSTGEIVRASLSSSGGEGNLQSTSPAITPDGRYVVFASEASDLVDGDTNLSFDVFRRDLAAGETIRVSVASDGTQGNSGSAWPAVSSDGRYVAFQSLATNLVSGDGNGRIDIFWHDCATGQTIRASVGADGGDAKGDSQSPSLTRDGQQVAFFSTAMNLVSDDVTHYAVYLRDIADSTTELVSIGDAGNLPDGDSSVPSISGDGRYVSFFSSATNLVDGDANGLNDVFVRDRQDGHTILASHTSAGASGNGASTFSALSSDGLSVAFESGASDLVDGDTNGNSDVFVFDLDFDRVTRVSVHTGDIEAHGDSHRPAISDDGAEVFFSSDAADLVDDDTNGTGDVFSAHHSRYLAAWDDYGDGWPGKLGVPSLGIDDLPRLGTTRTIEIGSSTDRRSLGFLVFGMEKADIVTPLDGTLLVSLQSMTHLFAPPEGTTFTFDIPPDENLAGLHLYFQWLELDVAASKHASFSPGLELILGS